MWLVSVVPVLDRWFGLRCCWGFRCYDFIGFYGFLGRAGAKEANPGDAEHKK